MTYLVFVPSFAILYDQGRFFHYKSYIVHQKASFPIPIGNLDGGVGEERAGFHAFSVIPLSGTNLPLQVTPLSRHSSEGRNPDGGGDAENS